jgi:hypothetical protein
MAPVATDKVPLGEGNRVAFDPETSSGGNLSKGRAQEISPMTRFAPGLVLRVKLAVAPVDPRDVVHVVETVGAVCGQLEASGLVANRAVHEFPRVALKGFAATLSLAASSAIGHSA